VSPWQLGISLNRYYQGETRWVTLPLITDHRIHRYDLFKAKMISSAPIDDVLDLISHTLRSGNRVWFVGGISLLRDGEAALSLPPAPNSKFGWNNITYMGSWIQQLSAFIRAHATQGMSASPPATRPVNIVEDVPLVVVQGWRD
jgi:hypothetical protein